MKPNPMKFSLSILFCITIVFGFSQINDTVISEYNNEIVTKLTDTLSPEFYKVRYNENDLLYKITDNYGNNFEDLYGTRNMRPILHGVAYRGGGNNYYHKTAKRKNQNPLPNDGVLNLCQEGFSTSVYLYQKNADSIIDNQGCNCTNGSTNNLNYVQLDYFDSNHIYQMVKMAYESAKYDSIGPIYLHCWNGWHASGYISAILLKQFCGYTNLEATSYWDIATDGANKSSRYRSIRDKIENFVPYPEFKLEDELGNRICPPMPSVIDSSKIHLEIQHLSLVPEAIPVNYRLILYEIQFASGKTTFSSPSTNQDLIHLKDALRKDSDLIVEIGGHTDRSGNEAKNKVLSQKRAKYVYDYLIKEGISSSQLRYKGYGSSYPAFSNKYKSGRASNRRIEVKIIQKRDYGTGTLVNESAYEDILLKLENIKYDEFKINQSYIMTNLNFESGKSELTDSNNKDLTGLLLFLNSNPNVTIEIGGFTDNSGMKEKNDTISQLRAQSVHSFLIQKGIATEKLDYIGYGSKNPISSNQQKWGRDKNRRIEIKIISK